jgi:hypothetical protein
MDQQPWPTKYVSATRPKRATIDAFTKILDTAQDEKPLQAFLAIYSEILHCLLPSAEDRWTWDRPQFGNQLIPDFVLCARNSKGFNWTLIELESPTEPPLTKSGIPASKLNTAMTQVRDWRSWLRQNVAYAQTTLGLRQIHAQCESIIIVGRRSMLDSSQTVKYAELSIGPYEVMSYDRLVEAALAQAD